MPGGSAHRPGYVLAELGRFGSRQGWGPAPPLGPEVAEAFVVAGLAGRAASTKGTYRSVLRSLGDPSLRAQAGPGPPPRLAPHRPKRLIALKKEQSCSPWPPPNARRGGGPRP